MAKPSAAKSSGTQAAATSPKAVSAQNSLVRIAVRGAAVGLLAVIACFIYLLIYEVPRQNRDSGLQLTRTLAESQAQSLNDWVQQTQARLAAQAKNPALLALLTAEAPDAAAAQTLLQPAFPEALTLRVLPLGPLGIAGLRTSGPEGLRNNIEVDMLRRISDGAGINPEAYQADKVWLVSFAQPVVDGANRYASAAILLTIPAKSLEQMLGRHSGDRGGSALLQQVGNQIQTFASAGSGDAQEFRHLQPLSVEQWRLQVTPAWTWLKQSQQPLWLMIVLLGVSVAAILAGVLITARDFRGALERNIGGLLGSGPLDLPGFAVLRQQLLQRKPQASAPERAEAPAGPAAAPKKAEAQVPQVLEEQEAAPVQMPDTIFRAYDIRGIAKHQLTDDIVYQLGLAIGSEAVDRGQQEIIVGRDGRDSSPAIADALVRGLRDSGRNVIDIGMVPTPVLYFATHQLGVPSGVMVTGSHNPPGYNGLKMVLGGKPVAGRAVLALKERVQQRNYTRGKGTYRTEQIDDQYLDYIANDVAIAQPLKIVIDAGNGVTGAIAPRLFQELGCEVIPLYCNIDPSFPHHHPDPTIAENLADLVQLVRENGADLGIAFDGDGDRVGVVTGSGEIVAADRLLMLLAQDVVSRNPGADVLFDVKCSRNLNSVISSFGGRPIMWKSGHSFMKEKMAETGALLGGEFSGHIFFNERWFGFDDGMYAAARLIEILSTTDPNLDNHLAALPSAVSTPELKLEADEQAKFDIIAKLVGQGKFGDGKITTLDGVRVDFPDGWGLVRASNTTPSLTLRFEADDETALQRIQDLFKDQLAAIDPRLTFGF